MLNQGLALILIVIYGYVYPSSSWVFVAIFVLWGYVFYQRQQKKKKVVTKPLIILDFNGVTCYREFVPDTERCKFVGKVEGGTLLHNHMTWIRPGWFEFRDELFKHCRVAVWSSCKGQNFINLRNHLFGERVAELHFSWDNAECVADGISPKWGTENPVPNFTKPLQKVWERFPDVDPKRTLMIDDSPEKMKCNPEGTYLIVSSWTPDQKDDKGLEVLLSQCLQ
jgi:hypothetical protein